MLPCIRQGFKSGVSSLGIKRILRKRDAASRRRVVPEQVFQFGLDNIEIIVGSTSGANTLNCTSLEPTYPKK
jgi:hypothetical protein